MPSVNQVIDAYLASANVRRIGATQENALAVVRRCFGNVDVDAFTPGLVNVYVNGRRLGCWTKAHAKVPAKDGTIRRELGALNAALAWGHAKGLTSRLVTADMPPPSPPRTNTLSKADADRFWAECHARLYGPLHRPALFALIAIDTGARAASIEDLTWDQIDFERGIDFRTPGKTQTAKRQAVVPLSDRLALVLSSNAHLSFDDVVGPVSRHEWQKLLAACGMDPVLTRHDLRRTFASLAVARGVDILKVATALGDNVQTVLKHYAHFAPNYLEGLHK